MRFISFKSDSPPDPGRSLLSYPSNSRSKMRVMLSEFIFSFPLTWLKLQRNKRLKTQTLCSEFKQREKTHLRQQIKASKINVRAAILGSLYHWLCCVNSLDNSYWTKWCVTAMKRMETGLTGGIKVTARYTLRHRRHSNRSSNPINRLVNPLHF